MKNEAINIASTHIELSQQELSKCAEKLYELLEKIESSSDVIDTDRYVHEAIATLQMQDIITQRLEKIKAFLHLLDRHVDLELSHQYLKDFAWENEIDQNDIDTMFNKS